MYIWQSLCPSSDYKCSIVVMMLIVSTELCSQRYWKVPTTGSVGGQEHTYRFTTKYIPLILGSLLKKEVRRSDGTKWSSLIVIVRVLPKP